ncbi:hypothetical protein Q3H58_004935 [Pseudomonas psychrotolerans]|nr:hypothetical protein [Pseudomonas psychrotolerans]
MAVRVELTWAQPDMGEALGALRGFGGLLGIACHLVDGGAHLIDGRGRLVDLVVLADQTTVALIDHRRHLFRCGGQLGRTFGEMGDGGLQVALHLRQGGQQAGGFVLTHDGDAFGKVLGGDTLGDAQGFADGTGDAANEQERQDAGGQQGGGDQPDDQSQARRIDVTGFRSGLFGAPVVELDEPLQLLLHAVGDRADVAIDQGQRGGIVAAAEQGFEFFQQLLIAVGGSTDLLVQSALLWAGNQRGVLRDRIGQGFAVVGEVVQDLLAQLCIAGGRAPQAFQSESQHAGADQAGLAHAFHPVVFHDFLGVSELAHLHDGGNA